MTDVSNTDDVIDVRDIIARVEELREARKPWVAGWNMPGYMPDSEPAEFETFADACEYIADAMEEQAVEAYELVGCADGEEERSEEGTALDATAKHVRALADTAGEYGETVGKYHYFIAEAHNAGLPDDDAAELATLEELLSDLEGNGGDEQWNGSWYPITLIRDDHFESYAEELADDCCPYPSNSAEGKALQQWPYRCIDWKQAARELQQDYSSVEFDGVTYWYR